ncbi:MAG: rRNA-intervening sequence protein [Candidatus Saccharibacteria bacterium]|nr:rRNA-intervening sequence protein [Candidatus Saccharibacteria bacterium]
MTSTEAKLEQLSLAISADVYKALDHFSEDEQWGMQTELRHSALDVTTDTAEALGSIDPRDKQYSYGRARKALFVLRATFKLAQRTGIFAVEPDLMVAIQEAIKLIDPEIERATKDIPSWFTQNDYRTYAP